MLEHAHLWTVSQTAEEAWQDVDGLVRSGRRRASRPGRGSDALSLLRRRQKRDPGSSQGNASGSGFRRLERGFGLAKFFLGRVASSVVSHAPCSVEIVRITGRQAAGRSQDTSGDRWLRVFGARRAIDRGSALARGYRDRSAERGGAASGNRAGLVRAALRGYTISWNCSGQKRMKRAQNAVASRSRDSLEDVSQSLRIDLRAAGRTQNRDYRGSRQDGAPT